MESNQNIKSARSRKHRKHKTGHEISMKQNTINLPDFQMPIRNKHSTSSREAGGSFKTSNVSKLIRLCDCGWEQLMESLWAPAALKPNQHKTAEPEQGWVLAKGTWVQFEQFPQGMGTPAQLSKRTSPKGTGQCDKAVEFPRLSHLPNTWEKVMWWHLAVLTDTHCLELWSSKTQQHTFSIFSSSSSLSQH